MDLIHGYNFLSKVAYKITPRKSKELNKKVQELLRKGLIQESLSSCVVLAILAPNKVGEWRMCTDSQAIKKITIK